MSRLEVTYGKHPSSRRSRRVHRARDVRGPLGLAAFVIALVWLPPVAFLAFAATTHAIHWLFG